ncbi:hypothetical protein ES689_07695 [Frigoribacterium sp. ACAM 257]|uniref:hypothetical protein n=1 Tax=Frigoribacterium sp. ACAM 257 TaxID=2508998 RepID=UPI0011B9BD7A|nr:hypothetical protein [Frigoribacterium sp. ACAM 257]TWX38508.1 hypothetical protein ES689_07695 [Frigoribacterium sp. ACAM 257]
MSRAKTPEEERRHQSWRDFFARGERYDVHYLPERWNAIVRRNVVTAVVTIDAAVVLVAVLVWWGRLGPLVLGGVLAVVMAIYALMALRTRAMLMAQSGGVPGFTLGVSDEGLHTPVQGIGTIAWSEVLGVFLVDDHKKVDALRASRGLQGAAARFAAKNGSNSVSANVVLPDGKALRRRIARRSHRGVVQTWAHHDGPQFGVISFALESATDTSDPSAMPRLGLALTVQCEGRGIPTRLDDDATRFAEHMMRISNVFDYSGVDATAAGTGADSTGGQSRT